jgi:hypothetical protein
MEVLSLKLSCRGAKGMLRQSNQIGDRFRQEIKSVVKEAFKNEEIIFKGRIKLTEFRQKYVKRNHYFLTPLFVVHDISCNETFGFIFIGTAFCHLEAFKAIQNL